MKRNKLLPVVLAGALALTALCACGSGASDASAETAAEPTAAASAEVDGDVIERLSDLSAQGFHLGCVSWSDGVMTANFTNDDHSLFRQAVCTMTLEQSAALFALDPEAENYTNSVVSALAQCEDLQLVTPEMPDMTIYEAFVGKTIGDMEDEGMEIAGSGFDQDENSYVDLYAYPDDDTTVTIRVYPEGAESGTLYDDDAIRDLTVAKVVFWEFD